MLRPGQGGVLLASRGILQIKRLDELRHSEIQELHHSLLGHEDVLRFQIPVHDAYGVCGRERIRHLDRKTESLRNLHQSDALPEGVSLEELHHDEMNALVLGELVNDGDIGVVE